MLTSDQQKQYYKTQSGLANPMSPLAYEKSLASYNPDKVQTSQGNVNPDVITSKDYAQKFNEKKNKYDEINTQLEEKRAELKEKQGQLAEKQAIEKKQKITETKEEETGSGNVAYDTYQASLADAGTQFDAWEEEQRSKQDKRYRTGLADLDVNLATEIQQMNETFDLRLKEQRRINELNVSRVRAYGLGHGGIYKPLQFGDAVTNREQEASDKIDALETRRATVLQKIKSAFEQGKSGLLDDLDDEYENIKREVYDKIREAKEEGLNTYKLQVKLRKEEEAKDLLAREEIVNNLRAFIGSNKEEYEDMTPEEIQEKALEVVTKYNVPFYEAYNAIMEGIQVDLKSEKAKADIAKTEAGTKKTEADIKLQEEKVRTEKSKQFKSYKEADKTKGDLDKPLSPNELRTMRDDYGFSKEDLPPNSTMKDAQTLQAQKFLKDNKGKDPEEVKRAIAENTNLEMSFIDKLAKSVYEFFGGKKKAIAPPYAPHSKRNKKEENNMTEIDDILNSF